MWEWLQERQKHRVHLIIHLPSSLVYRLAACELYSSTVLSASKKRILPFCLASPFTPTLLSLGKHTSLYKHSISFAVCLRALVCLKGFSKVCWHFLIAYLVLFLCSSWAITLGKSSTSSISFKTVWICGCAFKQEGRPSEVSRMSSVCFVKYQGNSG